MLHVDAIEAALREAGGHSGEARDAAVTAWLDALPRPVAIFCSNDIQAEAVIGALRGLRVAVPEEAAVMGVDDDPLICEFPPGTSSVRTPAREMGVAAANLLESMMRGCDEPGKPLLVPPPGVTVRGSTQVVAQDDPLLARALQYIREHACEGISVKQVVAAVPVSRREFEKQCKRLLGRTPLEQIYHVRMNEARRLLTQTRLPVAEVAARCGFSDSQYLSRVFGKAEGATPREYRKRYQEPGE